VGLTKEVLSPRPAEVHVLAFRMRLAVAMIGTASILDVLIHMIGVFS
jgi:hypothetical protein